MVWKASAPEGNEALKVRWELVPYTRGKGLDLGCGPCKPFGHFRGIDSNKDAALFGIEATAADFIIPTCEVLEDFASQSQDFIFSSHLLEHIENYKAALKEWWRVLKQGGYLCLYLPHKKFYPNKGEKGANPDHRHDFEPQDIVDAMRGIGGWDLLENQDRSADTEYSFFQVYKKFSAANIHRYTYREPKPEKTCAVIRYGAWGDCIQASSILPALKDEGYHVTLYTMPRSWEAVKHEPLIDAVVLQDENQVPNQELGLFFKSLEAKYDKVVNLCESVEATFLAMHDRAEMRWPQEARHRLMNVNYTEFAHLLAGVKYDRPHMRFVPSVDEREWAKKEYKKLAAAPLIMWVIRGSSIHKVWNGGIDEKRQETGMDGVLLRIMTQWPNAKIVTVGDQWCRDKIEPVWAGEPRIVRRSAVWTIRETMAMAQLCDMVIGPETGVMSAVAMEPMRKIVFMSHSTVENLTRDWVNTASLEAKTGCRACHKLVFTWEHCKQAGDTGIAECQSNISPEMVWDAIRETLDQQEQEAA